MPLVIRQEQIRILEAHALERYAEQIIVHLRKFWPEVCDRQGSEGARQSVGEGIERARRYGLRTELDIARFIDVMYLCHLRFDTQPQYQWARRILMDATLPPRTKMDQICKRIIATAKE